jgi:hypothetical protein
MTNSIDKELGIRMNGLDDFLNEHLGRLPLARVLGDLQIHVALQPALTIIQDDRGHTLYCGTAIQALCGFPITVASRTTLPNGLFRLQTSSHRINGQRYTLLVATDLHSRRELLARFRALIILIVPLALICAAVGGYWLNGLA